MLVKMTAETDEQIREEHRKIYKDVRPLSKDDFSNPTKSQKSDLQKLEAKTGKIVLNKEDEIKKKKVAINKHSGNGRLPLRESVVIGELSKFVTLSNSDGNGTVDPIFSEEIETSTDILIPKGTIDTQTPLPYIFSSKEELLKYLKIAISDNLDSLFTKVQAAIRKYVNVEEHYYPLLAGDIIWTYFQDKFPYTHYLIFTGDNGSGKNSALLVFRLLGYRVFYVFQRVPPTITQQWGVKKRAR